MRNIAGLRPGQVPPELGRVGYGDTTLPCTSLGQARPAGHSTARGHTKIAAKPHGNLQKPPEINL